MIEQQHIWLRKQRSNIDSISAAFDYFRSHFKMLFMTYLRFGLLPIVIGSSIFGFTFGQFNSNMAAGEPSFNIPLLLLGVLFLMISYTFNYMIPYISLKLHLDPENQKPTPKDFGSELWKNLGRVILVSIVVGFIVALGFMFLIIPGIYFSVALSMVFAVLVIESATVGKSIKRSMDIVNTKWWATFGLLLLNAIIVMVISYAIMLPVQLLSTFIPFLAAEGSFASSSMFGLVYMISFTLQNIFTQFLYYFSNLSVGIWYLSRVEDLEEVGLQQRVEQM